MSKVNPLAVIDAGPGWIAVDKPANMSVHNDPGLDVVSLLKKLLNQDVSLARSLDYGRDAVMGPVHRLDRETSGVMLMGLNSIVSRFFSQQFEQRTAEKHYVALVHGEFDRLESHVVWTYPLGLEAGGRTNPRGRGRVVSCSTGVRLKEQSPHYALIECELLTGRKHQIRRHAKMAGHPVIGDKRYGSKRAVDFFENRYGFVRLGLHSRSLTVALPGSGEKRTFESPIPHEFLAIIREDRNTVMP